MMLLLSLASRHKITYSALSDILRVVCMHLPSNSVPTAYKSLHRPMKAMASKCGNHGNGKIVHRLCGTCHSYLQDGQCDNPSCCALETQADPCTFLELPVDAQIKHLFQGMNTSCKVLS